MEHNSIAKILITSSLCNNKMSKRHQGCTQPEKEKEKEKVSPQ
jgi:hypothetical protein